jgi:aryl-alcohol dehydrogenase-like predicted oxidoreductase
VTSDLPLSHAAIRYVLHHPAVATAIPGASRFEQIKENAETAQAVLPDQTYQAMRNISKPNVYDQHR